MMSMPIVIRRTDNGVVRRMSNGEREEVDGYPGLSRLLPNGEWRIRRRHLGVAYRFSTRMHSLDAAKRVYTEWEYDPELVSRRYGARRQKVLDVALKAYLTESKEIRRNTAKHLAAQQATVGRFVLFYGPKLTCKSVSKDSIERYLETRSDLKATSLCLEITLIRGFFRWLVDREELNRDPTSRIKAPRPKETSEDRRRIITSLQLSQIREIVPQWVADAALVMQLLGLRWGETMRVRQCDMLFRLDAPELQIPIAKSGKQRVVPMVDPEAIYAVERLALWIKERPKRRTSRSGKFNAKISAACKKLKIPRFTAHALRHSCATRWADQGMNVYDMQRWLGHSNVEQTQEYIGQERKSVALPQRLVLVQGPLSGEPSSEAGDGRSDSNHHYRDPIRGPWQAQR